MRPRLLSVCIATAAVTGFLAGSPRASAEIVTLSLAKPPAGYPNGIGEVRLDGGTVSGAPIGPLYWSQYGPNGLPYQVPPNGNFPNQVSTFCIELGMGPGQLIEPGVPYTFGVIDPAAALGGTKTEAVKELFGQHYNPGWATPGFGGSAESVAFQIALWELIYDGLPSTPAPTSLNSGRFSLDVAAYDTYRGGAGTLAQTWLNNLTGSSGSFGRNLAGHELVVLRAPAGVAGKPQTPTQDQITIRPSAIPAPPGVILAGLGFIGLLGRARWSRRKPVAG
jgi:hypothetical protein